MSLQRTSFRLSHIEQALLPKEIDAKIILQAFKMQENKRILSSNRAHLIIIQQKTQEIGKRDLLSVTGKLLQSFSPDIHRRKSHKKDKSSIRQVLQKPMKNIFKIILEDEESNNYSYELDQLKKKGLHSEFPEKKLWNEMNKGIFSHKDLETVYLSKGSKPIRLQNPMQSMQYYEEMILNNPVLYKKIMNAYNASKRQLERENFKTNHIAHTFTARRETFYENKLVQKSSFSEMAKAHTDSKKFIYFMQYREFLMSINLSNKLLMHPHQQTYKAYICKGNNGLLLKSIIKSRPWWTIKAHSEIQQCNLIWTQWKKPKIINSLKKSDKKINESEIKILQIGSFSKKREYVLLGEKKIGHLRKIIKKQDKLWSKYERIPHYQNYLIISNKINDPNFNESSKEIFKEAEYTHCKTQRDNRMHNHLPGCLHLHSKKLLFMNLKGYYEKLNKDIFTVVPLTFHVTKGSTDPEFIKFSKYYEEQASSRLNMTKINKNLNNIWICKPGQNSNRGNGITVLNKLSEIEALVNQRCSSLNKTLIIQKYFENPFLYCKRKFDIRCYILITTINGILKGYWYEEGYIRTSSKEFCLKNLDNKFIHLTNDAIQKKGEEYGKFQNYNKISYKDFEKYLEQSTVLDYIDYFAENFKFEKTIQSMKEIATQLIVSTANKLNPKMKEYSFEIFGLDFMLDDKLNPFIIEANSNPCIEVDGNVLSRIIPQMLQNVIRIAIDPIFPPPYSQISKNRFNLNSNPFQSNRFILVYDSFWQNSQDQATEYDKNNIQQQEQPNQQQIQ